MAGSPETNKNIHIFGKEFTPGAVSAMGFFMMMGSLLAMNQPCLATPILTTGIALMAYAGGKARASRR